MSNSIESQLQKLPIVERFETPDELSEHVNTLMAIGYMNLMARKYHNEEIPIKYGDPFIVMAIGDSDDCLTLSYTEDTLSDSKKIDNVINLLAEEEKYEICDVLFQWKNAYYSKFSK